MKFIRANFFIDLRLKLTAEIQSQRIGVSPVCVLDSQNFEMETEMDQSQSNSFRKSSIGLFKVLRRVNNNCVSILFQKRYVKELVRITLVVLCRKYSLQLRKTPQTTHQLKRICVFFNLCFSFSFKLKSEFFKITGFGVRLNLF